MRKLQADTPELAFDKLAEDGLYDDIVRHFHGEESRMDDIDLYLRFIEVHNLQSPFLEIGAGTGRVLLPLLARGYQLAGVEISSGMLAACRKKTRMYLEGGQLKLSHHDFVYRSASQQYGLVLGTWFVLNYVPTNRQEQFLHHVYDSVATGGFLIIDLFNPVGLRTPRDQNVWASDNEITRYDGSKVQVHEVLTLIDNTIEDRREIFTFSDGKTKAVRRRRFYVPPDKAKSLMEIAHFRNITRVRGYSGCLSTDFSPYPEDHHFLMVGYKSP